MTPFKSQRKKIPQGLARVRKAIPPPAKVFKSKKSETRQRSKKDLRQQLKESLPPGSS
jgi:hypothetical protein